MEIFLNEIPEEGLTREGELPPSIFDLPPDDPIRPVGPVRYAVTIHRCDGGAILHGSLHGSFQLQCSLCLEYFDYDSDYSAWASDVVLEDGERSFDLGAVIREEFLLDLPPSPRCEDFFEGRTCPRAERLREIQNQSRETDPDEGGSPPDAWKVLDDLAP